MTTLNVRWEPAEGRVKEYKVIYAPAAGGAESVVRLGGKDHCPLLRLRNVSPLPFIVSGLDVIKGVALIQQEKVSAGTSNTILRNLQPDTVYTVSLVPVYAEGDGKTASENGKTSELPVVLLNK